MGGDLNTRNQTYYILNGAVGSIDSPIFVIRPFCPMFWIINSTVKFSMHLRGFNFRFLSSISSYFQGFIIAFTSNFIPRIVYMFVVSEDHSLNGFLNHSLAIFNVSDFEARTAPRDTMFPNVTVCRWVPSNTQPMRVEIQPQFLLDRFRIKSVSFADIRITGSRRGRRGSTKRRPCFGTF